MLIKYPALLAQLKKNIKAIYILTGTEPYLLNETVLQIKTAWRLRGESDEKILSIHTPTDWNMLPEEANSYSLFTELMLLDIRFDKKTIDATAKNMFNHYLQDSNSRCLIIIQAPLVPAKQWQWLSNHEQAVVVQIAPLSKPALQAWIATQLKARSIQHHIEVPSLIHEYSQNNMLACAQLIEKLALVYNEATELTIHDVKEHLVDQCEFQLYELADACLSSNAAKAIHLLRYAHNTKVEPTLILWLLTQEIRQLIQLSSLLKQGTTLENACNDLKIWTSRASLYGKTLARLPLSTLYQLLHHCKQLDDRIKTSQDNQIWNTFETMALSLC